MINRHLPVLTLLTAMIPLQFIQAQIRPDKNLLTKMAKDFRAREDKEFAQAKILAKKNGWFFKKVTANGGLISLIGVDALGNPKYVSTYNNTIAAATTSTNQLWPGGSSGLNLSGSSAAVKGKIAIWDGGHPLISHVELSGRISLKDVSTVDGHSTHTTGTLIATGINPIARGMAFGAQQLLAYDFTNDASEMAAASSGLLVSNHSYGFLSGSGWTFDGTNWSWYGDTTISKSQAYGFGYYDANAQLYDSIAYNAPNYLITLAAGNARGYNGPAVDSPYLYNGNNKLLRSAVLANNPTYKSICNTADSKNTLVVGAVNGIPAGYYSPSDVSVAYFSSWGPTNDGRIKPDLVGDGVDVTSTWNTSTTAYSTQSGTSMATPNVCGSLYLLQEYYNKLHPASFMRSATLKGLAIHTADEAGAAPGPDYVYGWGLLDVLKASRVITSSYQQQSDTIIESTLANGGTYTFNVIASGKGPLVATLAWTDPPGTPVPVTQSLNNTTPMLVNDLDMRITSGAQVFKPWVLNPASPANPAVKGDNYLDNVEKINVDSVVAGQTYTITITHKAALARGQQAFSLVVSGVNGHAYCSSAPSSSSGTRIDSVSISNISVANPSGCTTYVNNTRYSIQVQPKQKLPIRIRLSSCDASVASKIVKVFIDYNNNGVFDSTELAAQSGVLSGDAVYSDSIATPSLTPGNSTIMRIVAVETTNAAAVLPCGAYGNGETDDFSVLVVNPANDLALAQIVAPASNDCGDDSERVVVSIRNDGIGTVSNIPVFASIKKNGSLVTSMNETYPGKIPPGFVVTYAFQQAFPVDPGTSYQVSSYVSLPNDQNNANDTLSNSITTAALPAAPSASASLSGDTVVLKINNPNPNATYFWYSSATSDVPLFATTDTMLNLNAIPPGNTFYVHSGARGHIGIKSKNLYTGAPGGGYQSPGQNFLIYNASVPVVLKTARLFTGNPGKIQFLVIDTLDTQPDGSYYYEVLNTTVIDVYATSPNPTAGSVAGLNPADTGAIFYINLPLPAGRHIIMDSTIDHFVDKTAVATASIFRNNNVTGNPYPFTIPGVISIIGNSAASKTNPNQYQSYYYYQYDMSIHTDDCISDRIAVPVSIPSNIDFRYGPNPVTYGNPITLLFNAGTSGNIQVELFDLLGRRCYSQNYSATGLFSTQISTGNLITGMYILSVKFGNQSYKKKILVTK